MRSAKSRNIRRRAGDDEDEGNNTPATPFTSNKPSATSKPKKTTSQPRSKTLLSFADDDDESPFSLPPTTNSSASSSLRFYKSSSAHKLTPSRDRIAPHPPSSLVPSNVQPQAGVYTKESLLELQKNTRTLAAPARNKPKPPEREPVVVLKCSIKPVLSNDRPGPTSKTQDFEEDIMDVDKKCNDLSFVENDSSSMLKDIKLGPGLGEDNEEMPDQAMIEAIKAKRERLRQAKAAAPDYIALDGGSNHGEAEGLSDEEPEFRGRIGFFGEKIGGHDKKGVFDDFEERAIPKGRGIGVVSDDEDEEDKMWEEEQVRKGLGKRLDDGVGNQGGGVSVNGVSSIRQSSDLQPSFGYMGTATSVMHTPVENVDMFISGSMSISQQADLAKKALSENFRRVQESHDRTMISLAKTEENLSCSLLNVASLESSLSAAA